MFPLITYAVDSVHTGLCGMPESPLITKPNGLGGPVSSASGKKRSPTASSSKARFYALKPWARSTKYVPLSNFPYIPNTSQPQKNPFTLPSILTPDPSAGVAKNLVLHGRTLDCVRAVTREEAGKLKEEGEKRREKADKRNLYLLREGGKIDYLAIIAISVTPAFVSHPSQYASGQHHSAC
jgi:hypothetical protein